MDDARAGSGDRQDDPRARQIPAQIARPSSEGADRALETGDVEPLVRLLVGSAEKGLRERFAAARAARNYPAGNVETGREYIEKYVPFIHYVERLYQSATTSPAGHEAEASAAAQHKE